MATPFFTGGTVVLIVLFTCAQTAQAIATMGALTGICLPGTYSNPAGSTLCTQCNAGTFSSGLGVSTCTACYTGTYASGVGSIWCPLCSAGTYASLQGTTLCTNCTAGTYSTALGVTNSGQCSSCGAGKYLVTPATCSSPTLSWLFKSPITGYYYLNLPLPQTVGTTVWNKIRINSTLSNTASSILLYMAGMNGTYETNGATPCYISGTQYDATYATIPSTFTDYGTEGSCAWSPKVARANMVGTPFGIRDSLTSFTGPGCSWSFSFSYACASSQECTCSFYGNCASCAFAGALSILNTTQFQADVNASCALYPYDPLLSCKGTETVSYSCTPAQCQSCPANTYNVPGTSGCTPCPPGSWAPAESSVCYRNGSNGYLNYVPTAVSVSPNAWYCGATGGYVSNCANSACCGVGSNDPNRMIDGDVTTIWNSQGDTTTTYTIWFQYAVPVTVTSLYLVQQDSNHATGYLNLGYSQSMGGTCIGVDSGIPTKGAQLNQQYFYYDSWIARPSQYWCLQMNPGPYQMYVNEVGLGIQKSDPGLFDAGLQSMQCLAGFYCTGNGLMTPCSTGTYSSAGAVSCAATCPSGTYIVGTSCTLCPAGSYCTGNGLLSACLAGMFSNAGASACTSACPSYAWAPAGLATCYNLSMPVNAFAADGNTAAVRNLDLTSLMVTTPSVLGFIPNAVDISPSGDFILLSSYWNGRIVKVDTATWTPSIVAGSGSFSNQDGVGASASFVFPAQLKVSNDGTFALVYDAKGYILRKVTLTNASVTTIAGNGISAYVEGTGLGIGFIGNIFMDISSDGTFILFTESQGNRIRKLTLTGSAVTSSLIAGQSNGNTGSADGTGTASSFNNPSGLSIMHDMTTAVVLDAGNQMVRLINLQTNAVTTLISSGAFGIWSGSVQWVGFDNLLIYNNFDAIYNITYPGGVSTVIAGNELQSDSLDGIGTAARFRSLNGMTITKCIIPGMGVDSSNFVCKQCSAGTYSDGRGRCIACPLGTKSTAGSISASACLYPYFKFDTRAGDPWWRGPDGVSGSYSNTGLASIYGTVSMLPTLGTVVVSTGANTVNGQTIPRGMQIWTVATTARYNIIAAGSAGGKGDAGAYLGGKGAVVQTQFTLTAGTTVVIATGQQNMYNSDGGGGGTFVSLFWGNGSFSTAAAHTLILVAGGGGGGATSYTGSNAAFTTSGVDCGQGAAVATGGGGGGADGMAGGVSGAAGASNTGTDYGGAAGGGGFIGNGGSIYGGGVAWPGSGYAAGGGMSFLNGAMGGYGVAWSTVSGGFGGGGAGDNAGGGGGGYSGGNSCPSSNRRGGGGGGSYDVNGASNTATQYTTWNTSVNGPIPANFSAGWCGGDGFAVISLCPPTTYVTSAGICAQCPAGSYCSGNGIATQCAAGTYSTAIGATDASVCTACAFGTWAVAGSSVCSVPTPTASFLNAQNATYWSCNQMYCGNLAAVVTVNYPSYSYSGCTSLNQPLQGLGNPSAGQWGQYCGAVAASYDICYPVPVVPNAYQSQVISQLAINTNGWYNYAGLSLTASNITSSANTGYTALNWGSTITPTAHATLYQDQRYNFPAWNTLASYCWKLSFTKSQLYTANSGLIQYLCPPGFYASGFTTCTLCPAGTWNDGTSSAWCYACPSGSNSSVGSTSAGGCACVAGTSNASQNGGTQFTDVGGFNVNRFTSSSTMTFPVDTYADILIGGAGGTGNTNAGGGGGAGAVVYYANYLFKAGNYTITVGQQNGAQGGNGGNTMITNSSGYTLFLAAGGGGGGAFGAAGQAGGSSGGSGTSTGSVASGVAALGSLCTVAAVPGYSSSSSPFVYANLGGGPGALCNSASTCNGGGGGGGGAAGAAATSASSGAGGYGVYSNGVSTFASLFGTAYTSVAVSDGTNYYIAGGGSGGGNGATTPGLVSGGKGGGGAGQLSGSATLGYGGTFNAVGLTGNTCSGGGGGSANSGLGGAGSNGLVLIRYSSCQACAAGTYSPAPYASNCTACVASTFSTGGASACTTCPALTSSAAGAGSCTPLYSTFTFDKRSGNPRQGPDGTVPYAPPMNASLGTTTISSGTLTLPDGVAVPRGFQVWKVQATARYNIVAAGAQGGLIAGNGYTSGRGAVVQTSYTFNAGDNVLIAVGQQNNANGGGGGGATFISKYNVGASSSFSNPISHTLILAAGGGGGMGAGPSTWCTAATNQCNGKDALFTTSGTLYNLGSTGSVAINGGGGGGSAQNGGNGADGSGQTTDAGGGAGGGGFKGKGGNSTTAYGSPPQNYWTLGGNSFFSGCAGGESAAAGQPGGFGGGGGAWNSGGGGGGYSGGQGPPATDRKGGGGGGSYDVNGALNAATQYSLWNTTLFGSAPATYNAGYNTGDGYVIISAAICSAGWYLSSVTCLQCPSNTFSVLGATACLACPTNSSSAPGASACTPNQGYYDLRGSTAAYYSFNPSTFLADVSGNTGTLSTPVVSPISDCTTAATGPGGAWASNCASAMQGNGFPAFGAAGSQYFAMPSMTFPSQFSICMWYQATPYTPASPNSYEYLITLGNGWGVSNPLMISRYGSANGVGFYTDNNWASTGWLGQILDTTHLASQTWYHVCYVVSSTTTSVYYNGVFYTSATMSTPYAGNVLLTSNTLLGVFQGKIDELRIFYKVLSATDVTAIYNYRGDGTSATLIAPCTTTCAANTTLHCSATGTALCCAGGTYFVEGVSTACQVCPAGTFGSGNTTACTYCNPGSYSDAGASACTLCAGGTYSATTAQPSSYTTPAPFTWLLRNPSTGKYYVRFPSPAVSQFIGSPGTVPDMQYFYAFPLYSTLQVNQASITLATTSRAGTCTSTGADATYEYICSSGGGGSDFGYAVECNNAPSYSIINTTGTPFGIQSSAYYGCSGNPYALTINCIGSTFCTVRGPSDFGNCGAGGFNGNMPVLNTAAFNADVIQACALYKAGTGLTCSGTETVTYAATSPCQSCAAGTYSPAGATNCTPCNAGSYIPSGASTCVSCPVGSTTNASGVKDITGPNYSPPLAQFSASSYSDGLAKAATAYAQYALNSAGMWAPTAMESAYQRAWMQFDLLTTLPVKAVVTQGANANSYVTNIRVATSTDGVVFVNQSSDMAANVDATSIVVNTLASTVYARYVRIYVLSFYKQAGMRAAVRLGLSGCTCQAGYYASVVYNSSGITECLPCPANSWSAAGAGKCTANVGYYDLGSNLMAYYPFNPNQMTADVSGNLGALTIPKSSPVADCTTAATGPGGSWASNCVSAMQTNAALLDSSASAQYFQIPSVILPASYSICLWYQPTPYSTPNAYEAIFDFHQSTNSYLIYLNRAGTSSNNALVTGNVWAQWFINWGGAYFSSNTWYHTCLTFSGTSYNIYFNGASVASGAQTSAQDSTQIRNANTLFTQLGGGTCFQGKIDEVRLYNKQLSASEVTAIYNFRGDTYTPVLPISCSSSCSAGTYGHCTPTGTAACCGAGTYFVDGVSTACQTCAAGTYGFGNATSCLTCPANTYSVIGVCTACPANTGAGVGASACVPNSGYYAAASNIRIPSSPYMSANTVTISGEVFVASASSMYVGNVEPPYMAFAEVADYNPPHNEWTAFGMYYSGTGSTYSGSGSTVVNGVTLAGEWLQLQTQTPRVYGSYALQAPNDPNRMPTSFVLAGSNDGVTWIQLDSRSGVPAYTTANSIKNFTVTNSALVAVTYVRLVILAAVAGAWTSIDELYLNPVVITACTTTCPSGTIHCTPTGTAVCCGAGTYFVEGVSTACQSCPAGTYGFGNATSCLACPANTTSVAGSSSCTACAANTWAGVGAPMCWSFTYPVFALVTGWIGGNVRKIDLATAAVTTVASSLTYPSSVAISPYGDYALCNAAGLNKVFKIDLTSLTSTLLAGSGTAAVTDDTGAAAAFNGPTDIKIFPDGTYALVVDNGGNAIRKIIIATGVVTTITGKGAGYAEGTGSAILLNSPSGIAISADGTFALVPEAAGNRIRKLTLTSGASISSLIAGSTAGTAGSADGIGSAASFNSPQGIIISSDMTVALVVDRGANKIRSINLLNNAVSTLVAAAGASPVFIAMGGLNDMALVTTYTDKKIYQMLYPSGTYSVFAGSGSATDSDGTGTAAAFNGPHGIAIWKCAIPGMGVDTSSSVCQRCPAGKYSNGQGLCVACPAGYTSAIASTSASACTQCPANTYNVVGIGCNPCAAGTTSPASASNCTCPAGTYAPAPIPYSLGIGDGNLNLGTGPTTIAYATPLPTFGAVALSTSINGNPIPQGIQTWTVGTTGSYLIVAAGAAGTIGNTYAAGKGVVVSTIYSFVKGQTVSIAVGQTPNVCFGFYGGGGATFVSIFSGTGSFSSAAQHTPVLVAGGGGAGGWSSDGYNAVTGTSGTLCPCCTGTAASNGGGGGGGNSAGGNGVAGTSTNNAGNSAGGGGFYGKGGDAFSGGTFGGAAFVSSTGPVGGGEGSGINSAQCSGAATGVYTVPVAGYGGGGGAYNGGGGGGGYSGGQGGQSSPARCGGGGGSFDASNIGGGNAAKLYSTWNTTLLGPQPSTFSAGYSQGSGFVYIVPIDVTCTACPANAAGSGGTCAATSGNYDLGSALMAYYPFNPNQMTVDVSGRTGSLVNTGSVASIASPTSTSPLIGWQGTNQIAYLSQPGGTTDGNSQMQYLSLPAITLPPAVTLCTWFYPTTAGSWQRIFDFGNGAPADNIVVGSYTGLNAHTYTGTTSFNEVIVSNGWNTNTWQHMCLALHGKTQNLYYNGILTNPGTQTVAFNGITYGSNSAWIGRSHWTVDPLYSGYFDEVRIYNRALSSAEVNAIYNFRGDTYTSTLPVACPANTVSAAGGSGCVPNAGYYFLSSYTRFPMSGMTAASSTINGEAFTASSSSISANEFAYQAFNNVLQTSLGNIAQDWTSATVAYNGAGSNGLKTYTASTYSTVVDGITYYGEWLQLQVGTARQLGQYSIQSAMYNAARAPSQFIVAGSNTGTTWTLMDTQTTLTTWTVNLIQTFYPNATGKTFTYFRLIVLASGATGDGLISIEEWSLYPASFQTPTIQFPSAAMTGTSTTIGGEAFVAGFSSAWGTTQQYSAFDRTTADWSASAVTYSSTDGSYIAATPYTTVVDGTSYAGEWIQLKAGVARQLSSYSIQAHSGAATRSPSRFVIAGSNDGTTWSAIDYQSGLVWTLSQTRTFFPNVTTYKTYTYFRLIQLAAGGAGGDGNAGLNEWSLFTGPLGTCSMTGCSAPATYPQCSTAGLTLCCKAGTYWVPSTTTAGCVACPAGTFASGSVTSCTSCAAGTFTPAAGASVCSACPAGSTSPSGSSSCPIATTNTAPAGQYWNGNAYVACPAGSFCVGGTALPQPCTNCSAGSYVSTACTASADAQCSVCAAGFTTTTNAPSCTPCTVCAAGQSVSSACTTTSDATCSACVAGTSFSTTTNAGTCSSCSTCNAGTYVSTNCLVASDIVCSGCTAGSTYSTTSNAGSCASCSVCSTGTYVSSACTVSSNSVCTPCVAGSTYSTTTNAGSCSSCTVCPAGQYRSSACTATANAVCVACTSGVNYCLLGSTAPVTCNVCQPGTAVTTVCTTSAAASCTACVSGTSYSTTTNSPSCTACGTCPNGNYVASFCNTTANIVCAQCPAGSVCSNPATANVTTCPLSNYCPAGTYVLTACAAGSYCPNTTSQLACSSGNFCPTGSTAQNACPAGSVCPTTTQKLACNSTYYCPAGSTAQVLCSVGSYCSTPNTTVVCGSGYFCPTGSIAQTLCAVGSYCATPSSQTACSSTNYCPAGSTAQTPCPAGFFCPNPSTQTACTLGSYCAAGSIAQTTCASGYYCPNATVQIACPAGSFCLSGSTAPTTCAICAAGLYQTSACTASANTTCQACSSGSYCPTNSLSQTPCAVGYVCPTPSVQMACNLTNYCPASSVSQVSCAIGSYCPNASIQLLCAPGSYCPAGSTNQTTCAVGYVCANPSQQTACTSGNYCPAGSTTQIACLAGSFCSTPATQVACTTPNYCPASSTTQALCSAGFYCPNTTAKLACPGSSYCVAGVTAPTACDVCVTGQYIASVCTASANVVCPACANLPANAVYSGVGTTVSNCPWVCNPSYYSNTSQCLGCPAGSWCNANVKNTCPTNAYSAAMSLSQNACLCQPGYFGNGSISGTSPCPMCVAGNFCPGGNNNISIACPTNFSSPVGASSYADCQCIPGYLRVDNATCQLCAPGQVCLSGAVSSCPPNSYAPSGSSSLSDCVCNPGFYGPAGGTCTQCPANSFCPGGNVKTQCTANAVSPVQSTNATACYCDRGYQGVANVACVACPANTWCWTGVLNNCPANTSSPPLSNWWLNCTCVPGYTGPDGSACGPCMAGTSKSANGSASCTTCPVKTYCPMASVNPTACPLTNSTSPAGSINISQCQCLPGYSGSQCSPCPSTSYCPGGAAAYVCPNSGYTTASASTLASQCTCPANSALNGSGVCECALGYQYVVDGASPAGWRCNVCPVNSYCIRGILNPCPTFSTAPAGTSSYLGCTCAVPKILNAGGPLAGKTGYLGSDAYNYNKALHVIRNYIFAQTYSSDSVPVTSWTVTTTKACTLQPFLMTVSDWGFNANPNSDQNYVITGASQPEVITGAGTFTFQWVSAYGTNLLYPNNGPVTFGWYDYSNVDCVSGTISSSGSQYLLLLGPNNPIWVVPYLGAYPMARSQGDYSIRIETNSLISGASNLSCSNCPANKYYLNNIACKTCPASSASPIGSQDITNCICNNGTYLVLNASAPDGRQCDVCLPGYFCQGNIANPCPPDSYCTGGTVVPTSCPVLSTAPLFSNASSACQCGDGYYMSGNTCVMCGYGTYAAKGTVGTCNQCPSSSNTSSKGSANVSSCLCQPGTVGDARAQLSPPVPISIINTCYNSACTVNALNYFDYPYVPSNLVDGLLTNRYVSQLQRPPGGYNWVQVDFMYPRVITGGWVAGFPIDPQRLNRYQIWIGNDPTFPGTNTWVYTSPNVNIVQETFPAYGVGQYLYVASNTGDYFQFSELDVYSGTLIIACQTCPANSYCPGNAVNKTIPCPNSTYSTTGAITLSQCACPAGSSWLPSLNCTCTNGTYKLADSNAPLGGWSCAACVPGTYCVNNAAIQCPANAYCLANAKAPTSCPALSSSNASSTSFAACLCPSGYYMSAGGVCTICGVGTYSYTGAVGACTACTANSNTAGQGSQNASSCLCQAGFYGDSTACAPCPRNSYCPGNKANYSIPCPNSTYTPKGASSVGQCTCPSNAGWLPGLNCTCNDGFYSTKIGCTDIICGNGTACSYTVTRGYDASSYPFSDVFTNVDCKGCVANQVDFEVKIDLGQVYSGLLFAYQHGQSWMGGSQCYRCCHDRTNGMQLSLDGVKCYTAPAFPTVLDTTYTSVSACSGLKGRYLTVTSSGTDSFALSKLVIWSTTLCNAIVSSDWQCSTCAQGTYCKGGNATGCPPGYFCPASSVTPVVCPIGFYCNASSSSAAQCPPNSNTSTTGSTSISQCICIPGYKIVNGNCTLCPTNTYCLNGQNASCPANLYSLPGSSSIAQCVCPANAVWNGSVCQCLAGLLQVSNASQPIGGWQCNPCPAASVCTKGVAFNCPAGSYCVNGLVIQCPVGYFCLDNSTAPQKCPAGSTSPPGRTTCDCRDGEIVVGNECVICQANTYCADNIQYDCPSHSTSPARSPTVAACACSPGFYSSGGECLTCLAGSFCAGGGSVMSNTVKEICP